MVLAKKIIVSIEMQFIVLGLLEMKLVLFVQK